MAKCAVKGCDATFNLNMFAFPNPEEKLDEFKNWIRVTGNEELLKYHPVRTFYNMKICAHHFHPKYWNFESNMEQIPHLNLPVPLEIPENWITYIEFGNDKINLAKEDGTASRNKNITVDDGIASADVWNFSYNNSMVENNNIFETFKATSESKAQFNLWMTSKESLKQELKVDQTNCEYVQYVLTKPSKYYKEKWNTMKAICDQQKEMNINLVKENEKLATQVRELKVLLLQKHI